MIRHAISAIADRLSDAIRPTDELTRRELVNLTQALGITHADAVEVRPELKGYAKEFWHYVRADSRRLLSRDADISPQDEDEALTRLTAAEEAMMGARRAIMASIMGPANAKAWEAMLRKEGPFRGFLEGSATTDGSKPERETPPVTPMPKATLTGIVAMGALTTSLASVTAMLAMLAQAQSRLGHESWAIDAGLAVIGVSVTTKAVRMLTAMVRSRRHTGA